MFAYKQSEPCLWTVGHYDSDGKWEPESDHASSEKAASRARYLNGGREPPKQSDTLEALLFELEEYFDERADADQPSGEKTQPNEEMELLILVRRELKKMGATP